MKISVFDFAVFENLSFRFLDVTIFQNKKHILTILKISFKFRFRHFVGAFFKKKFCCISAGCQLILKKNVYSLIVISSYEYGSFVTLGAFFSVSRGNYPGKEKWGKMSKNQIDVTEF